MSIRMTRAPGESRTIHRKEKPTRPVASALDEPRGTRGFRMGNGSCPACHKWLAAKARDRTQVADEDGRFSRSTAAFCSAKCVPLVPYFLIKVATRSLGWAPTLNQ